MSIEATGTVKESPAECEIGDWVLATGSNLEVQWLKKDERDSGEIEVDYPSIPDRHDRFRRAEKFGDCGDVWVRVS